MAEEKGIDWENLSEQLQVEARKIAFEKFIIIFAFICVGIVIGYNIIIN